MTIKANLSEDQILTIYLEGAIDSTTAPEAEAQIMEIYNAHTANAVVLDAEKLQYISSSGLRVLLRSAALTEASQEEVDRLISHYNLSAVIDLRACYGIALITGIVLMNVSGIAALAIVHKVTATVFAVLLVVVVVHKLITAKKA